MLRNVLERMAGSWTGEVVYTSAEGEEVERYTLRQSLEVAAASLRLTSVFERAGGTTWAVYEGSLDGDAAEFTYPKGHLSVRSAGPSAILLYGDYGDTAEIVEIISVGADGRSRSRVGMVTEHGVCIRRIVMTEVRDLDPPHAEP